ncbi:MAG: ABC transporter permease [Nanoarchaeota archaeon]
MKRLWLLTKKNLKLLIRSKSSALIIFFAPLLIILILGLSYNTSSKYGLNIGVYSTSFTEDVNSFISSLQEKEYKIVKYETSLEECVEDIKLGFIHTCVSIPESLQIEENKPKEIVFYIDPSKINLVWAIQEDLGNKFNLKAQELSQELAQNIITRLIETKTKVSERSAELNSVKEKSVSASTSTETLTENLGKVDLSMPTTAYDTAFVAGLKNNLSSEIESGLSEVTAAINAVESANISSGKTQIKTALNSIDEKLNLALTLVQGNGTNSLEGVVTLIASLEQDLTSTKTKLTSASEAISSTATSLSATTEMIKESIASLESVQQGLEEIKTNLESQKVTDANVISAPLITKIEKVSPEKSYLNYMFPVLLVLVIMFSSLLLGTTLVMMEKNSPAFFRNYFVPLKKGMFVLSIYLTNLIITLVQIIVILGVSLFFLKENVLMMFPIALILLLSSSVFTFLGMSLGYLFKSDETGVLASISLGSFLLFMSGVVLPLESVSPLLRKITYFNPFVISEKIIHELFLFGASFKFIWTDVAILIGYSIVLFLIILFIERVIQKHLIEHFMTNLHQKHRQKDKINKGHV